MVILVGLLVPLPWNQYKNVKAFKLSHGVYDHSLENKTFDPECSPLIQLRSEGIKIIKCASCIEQPGGSGWKIKAIDAVLDEKHCFLTKGCSDTSMIDGILWSGNTADSFPAARRNAANKHQIWIARATETHALPHVNRPIGNAEWMAPMNYARHFGTNTDFPAFGVPQKRS